MTQVKPSHIWVAFIMFTLFIMAGVSMLGIFNQSKSNFLTDQEEIQFQAFNNTFNKMTYLESQTKALNQSVQYTPSGTFGELGVLNALIGTAWNTLTSIPATFATFAQAIIGLSVGVGGIAIPVWFVGLIVLVISVIVAFAIFAAIFQREL